jgi:hypothetical protein
MINVFMGSQERTTAFGENDNAANTNLISLSNSKKKLSQPDVRIKKMSGALSRDTSLAGRSPQTHRPTTAANKNNVVSGYGQI